MSGTGDAVEKSYEGLKPGEQLCITATDQAFGRDVASWCRMTGAELLSLDTSNGKVKALIRKQVSEGTPCRPAQRVADNKTIVVFSDDLDKALASFVIANGAASTGKKVTMFFTFWGLNIIKKRQNRSLKRIFSVVCSVGCFRRIVGSFAFRR